MITLREFIDNLSDYDIDLTDKLVNLHDAGQISDTVYKLCKRKENFESIEYFIRRILQDDVDETELTEEYIHFIDDETRVLYEGTLIDRADDYSAGLYNCDEVYLYAISDVLFLEMDELDYYESEAM